MLDSITPFTSPGDPVAEVICQYLRQVGAGEVPDREALLSAHPSQAERLRAFFAEFDKLDRAAAEPDFATDLQTTVDEGVCADQLLRGGSLGDYELLHVIARGGMGVVYKARQVSLNRLVALKMILAGALATPRDVLRFRAEAEAAANFDHPHIVPIYEVGEHDGQHYYAMRLIEGTSLARHPRGDARAEAGRLAIVAGAVHYAHQRGILHRDLKPQNILVDPAGTPFVTDFGLAKRVDGDGSLSRTGELAGTPHYMAPEQASGRKDLTVTADVYSLGVVLYERLTGRTPFHGQAPLEILRQVRENEPPRPSSISRGLDRDLETICLKCLEKEPARRYPSAQALADDLERWLRGEPIQARPTSPWERGLKWARRRPALAALAAVSGAALVTVLIVILIANARLEEQRDVARAKQLEAETQRQRALAHLRVGREVVDQFLTRVGFERLESVPYMETLRRELLLDAVKFYQDFARQESDDPEVRYEVGRAWRRLGKVWEQLGDKNAAEESFRAAVKVQEQLAIDFPDRASFRQERAASLNNLAVTLGQPQQRQEALRTVRQAIDLQEQLTADFPNTPDYQQDLAESYDLLGRLLIETGQKQQAEQTIRRAVDLLEKVTAGSPQVLSYQLSLASRRRTLAVCLARQGRLADAEPIFRANRDLWERYHKEFPAVPRYLGRAADEAMNLGNLLVETSRSQEGEQLLRRAMELYQQLTEDFPKVPSYHASQAAAQEKVARLLLKREDFPAACPLLEQAIAHQRTSLKANPTDADQRGPLSSYCWLLADARLRLGSYRQAAQIAEELPSIRPDHWNECYQAARLLTRCISLAEKDQQQSADQRRDLVERYSQQAVEFLGEALRRGYTDVAYMKKDPGLDVLRGRDDFQRLLRDRDSKP